MALAWRTFQRFEAPVYPKEGCESFLEFISGGDLKRMFLLGRYRLYVAKDGDDMVGMFSIRENNHISLLFVDAAYHGCGIGRALICCGTDFLWEKKTLPLDNEEEMRSDVLYERNYEHFVTVNAAPGAVGFYERVGFERLGEQEEAGGILYVPMYMEEKA
ncbi:MAG: GNAT family N-acetyltransferase [Lachnospiraceae bacterium]|nr:GNAT family N-acetyltransferase [Lachnospiraceae bacterium]